MSSVILTMIMTSGLTKAMMMSSYFYDLWQCSSANRTMLVMMTMMIILRWSPWFLKVSKLPPPCQSFDCVYLGLRYFAFCKKKTHERKDTITSPRWQTKKSSSKKRTATNLSQKTRKPRGRANTPRIVRLSYNNIELPHQRASMWLITSPWKVTYRIICIPIQLIPGGILQTEEGLVFEGNTGDASILIPCNCACQS